jgi:hypothetical protein
MYEATCSAEASTQGGGTYKSESESAMAQSVRWCHQCEGEVGGDAALAVASRSTEAQGCADTGHDGKGCDVRTASAKVEIVERKDTSQIHSPLNIVPLDPSTWLHHKYTSLHGHSYTIEGQSHTHTLTVIFLPWISPTRLSTPLGCPLDSTQNALNPQSAIYPPTS